MSAISSKTTSKIKTYRHARVIQWLAASHRGSFSPPKSDIASQGSSKPRRHRRRHLRPVAESIDTVVYDTRLVNASADLSSPRHRTNARKEPPVIHHHHQANSPPTPPPTALTPYSSSSDITIFSSAAGNRDMPNETRIERVRGGSAANNDSRDPAASDLPRRPQCSRTHAQDPVTATTANINPAIDASIYLGHRPSMSWYQASRELQKRGVNVTIDLGNLFPDPSSNTPPDTPPALPETLLFPSIASPPHAAGGSTTTSAFSVPQEALLSLLPLRAVLEFKVPQVLSAASSLNGAGASAGLIGLGSGAGGDGEGKDVPITCHLCDDVFADEAERERHFEREETFCTLCKAGFGCAGRMRGRGHACAVLLGRVKVGPSGGSAVYGAGRAALGKERERDRGYREREDWE